MSLMALRLSRVFSKRLKINYTGITSIIGQNVHTDNDKLSALQGSGTRDVLMDNIKNANNSMELFSVISNHNQVFNQKHVLQALTSIHNIYRTKHSLISSSELINDPLFERLCVKLKKYSCSLNLYEIIEALKVFSFLDVPSNSSIIQILLQLIRKEINQLNIQQIIFLDFVLSRFNQNHLVDSLNLALPLVFQINLNMQMDTDNILHLADVLRYCSNHKIPQKLTTSVVTSILLNETKINKETAKSLLWSLCELNIPSGHGKQAYENLLKRCFKAAVQDINNWDIDAIIKTVTKLRDKILDNIMEFYDEDFFTACGNYVIKQNVNVIQGLKIAKIFSRISFTHLPLLEYLSDLIVEDSEVLTEGRPSVIFSFVNSLSNANYKPENWDLIEKQIFKNSTMRVKNIALPWTKFCLELASIDSYNYDLLDKIFAKGFLDIYLDRNNSTLDYIQLLTLYQAVKLFHPTYDGNTLPEKYFKKGIKIVANKEIDQVLKNALECGFGGPQYVASGVLMPNGYLVDFMIAFREGHYPIAINLESTDGVSHFEDLKIDKNSKILCIINHHKGCYSLNCNRIRGIFALSPKILDAMGYNFIEISSIQWTNLSESERIPYIMREVNFKTSHQSFPNAGNEIS